MKPKQPDTSPKIKQRSKVDFNLGIHMNHELNEKQVNILEASLSKNTKCVMIDGFWGTSKTYLSVLAALHLLNDKKVDEIIYIRNPIEASTTGKIGMLPGLACDKMAPYKSILDSKLEEFLDKATIDKLEKEERITCMPLGFVRGHSWNCKAIIVDEASSMTFDDLILLMSRCGERTRIFLVGDSVNQNDIGKRSGFAKMFEYFNDEESKDNGIYAFEMKDKADIVRSGFLVYVMEKIGILKKHESAPITEWAAPEAGEWAPNRVESLIEDRE